MNAPTPIFKGLFQEAATGTIYGAHFLQHNPNLGESETDDCFITFPVNMTGGEKNCGETGLFPKADFKNQFRFLGWPKPGQPFGSK